AYMASKAAVEALTRSLALQVARYRIRVNTICPGIIQTSLSFSQGRNSHVSASSGDDKTGTPLSAEAEAFFARFAARIPLGRVGPRGDAAGGVSCLAPAQPRQITGTALLIDGGQTRRRWISAPDLAPHLS